MARKIVATADALGLDPFDLKYGAGRLSHAKLIRRIELYGSRVTPVVPDMLA